MVVSRGGHRLKLIDSPHELQDGLNYNMMELMPRRVSVRRSPRGEGVFTIELTGGFSSGICPRRLQ